MKKTYLGLMIISVLLVSVGMVVAMKPTSAGEQCTTIQSGEIESSTGETITTGFDDWGYNYQARLFNGGYCDAYRNAEWCRDYKDVELNMKWNDAWLSNKDCDGDGKLDRHYGHESYIGSGAWLTNHQRGTDSSGEEWTYFVKVVAKPTVDYDCEYSIWGQFCVIQEVSSGEGSTLHGEIPGLGIW